MTKFSRVMIAAAIVLAAPLAGLALGPAMAAGQEVEVRGRGDAENDAYLRALVRSGGYVLIAQDTLIATGDTIAGTALVLGATVRIDGLVTGDLVIVDANVFLRPNARILGNVRNIAGGYYPSEQATIAGGQRTEPNAPYRVRYEADGARVAIIGIAAPSVIVRPGIFGFSIPTYDRVDGLTLTYGSGLLLPRLGGFEPVVNARVDYRSQRGAITGGAELLVPRGGTALALGAERTTLTNERWIRGDLTNSLSFLAFGRDARDYYEADRIYGELRHTLETGPRTSSAFVRTQLEAARTLRAGSPWTVFGTPRADNIVIDNGRIGSVIAGGLTEWDHPLHNVRIEGHAESAFVTRGAPWTFARYLINADWAMLALSNHTLRIQPHLQGPLPGTDSLPRQRWSFVGGAGTLETFDMAEFRGDRVVFVETQYIIPLPVRIRFLGTPNLELLHLAGMAWTDHEYRPLEQNVGARLQFALVHLRFLVDPATLGSGNDRKYQLSLGVNVPRTAYAWERAARDRQRDR
jgi:hypothetical protein